MSYYHLSCTNRRASIQAHGLQAGHNANLNENPTNTLYFINMHEDADEADMRSAYGVMCWIRHHCGEAGAQVDIWKVDDDAVAVEEIIPGDVDGEYMLPGDEDDPAVVPAVDITLWDVDDLPGWAHCMFTAMEMDYERFCYYAFMQGAAADSDQILNLCEAIQQGQQQQQQQQEQEEQEEEQEEEYYGYNGYQANPGYDEYEYEEMDTDEEEW